MKKLLLIVTYILMAGAVSAGIVGHWNLNGNLNNDIDGKSALSFNGVTLLNYATETISSSSATVLSIPKLSDFSKLIKVPNGNSTIPSKNYTIIMDVKFPTISGFTALLWFGNQTFDGDFFIHGNGEGIGINAVYPGTIYQDTWYRIALAAYDSGNNIIWSKYIDGSLVGTQVLDNSTGRYSLTNAISLFVDNDGETAAGKINSFALFDEEKNSTFISNLGSPTAGGISTSDSALVGLWQFNDSLANEVSGGKSIYLTNFVAYSKETISSSTAQILSFPPFTPSQWIQMPNQASSSPFTENYTIVFDVKFAYGWATFYKSTTSTTVDGSLFLASNHTIGLGSAYDGTFNYDTWHRVAITLQQDGSGGINMRKYIDGSNVGGTVNYNDHYTNQLILKSSAYLLTDNSYETSYGAIGCLAYYDDVKSDSFISGLGSPSALGIPIPKPTTQAYNITSTSIGDNSIGISWSNGDGNGKIVVCRQDAAPASNPVDGTVYTASGSYGSGSSLGGGYVVYKGASSSVSVSGLAKNTEYYFQAYEYNSSTMPYYYTSTATDNPNSFTTTPEPGMLGIIGLVFLLFRKK